MRKPKAFQQHRRPAEKPTGPQAGKASGATPPARTPPDFQPRTVHPPRRRPWLLAVVSLAMIAWLAVLVWLALSAPPPAS